MDELLLSGLGKSAQTDDALFKQTTGKDVLQNVCKYLSKFWINRIKLLNCSTHL